MRATLQHLVDAFRLDAVHALADDTAVLVDGRVVEHRPVRDLLAAPRTPFAARISGVNLVTGRSDGSGRVVTEGGTVAAMIGYNEAKRWARDKSQFGKGDIRGIAGPETANNAAATGDALISPELTVDLLARSRASGRRDAAAAATLAELTAREREVAQCVARGRTNAEIADELVISLGTVKTHLGAITRRLGARNRVEVAAAMWAAGEMD